MAASPDDVTIDTRNSGRHIFWGFPGKLSPDVSGYWWATNAPKLTHSVPEVCETPGAFAVQKLFNSLQTEKNDQCERALVFAIGPASRVLRMRCELSSCPGGNCLQPENYSSLQTSHPFATLQGKESLEVDMSIEKFVEEQVRRAIDAGEFDNLAGKGKLLDLRAYFETPEDLRMAHSILKGNNFVPEEVELLKEIQALKKRLESTSDEEQKGRLKKEITDKTLTFNMLIEKHRRRR